jgi:hypothetical protein
MEQHLEDRTMKKQILSLSVAAATALAGAMPASYADDEDEFDCIGLLVQSRFALANCMVESAVAIAAAAASDNGCQAGEWEIDSIVPEFYQATIPIQGLAHVYNGLDSYDLTGQSSAQLQNNVNCQVNTTSSGNTYVGEELTYSAGSGNYYVDAVIDKDNYLLCITQSVSEGNIAIGDEDFDEQNYLMFDNEDDIRANGLVSIYGSTGGGNGQGSGNGGSSTTTLLSDWIVNETAKIPEEVCIPDAVENYPEDCDLGEFDLTATTNDVESGCKIEVDGTIQNLLSYTVEGLEGGLTIAGTLSVGPDDVDDDD